MLNVFENTDIAPISQKLSCFFVAAGFSLRTLKGVATKEGKILDNNYYKQWMKTVWG